MARSRGVGQEHSVESSVFETLIVGSWVSCDFAIADLGDISAIPTTIETNTLQHQTIFLDGTAAEILFDTATEPTILRRKCHSRRGPKRRARRRA